MMPFFDEPPPEVAAQLACMGASAHQDEFTVVDCPPDIDLVSFAEDMLAVTIALWNRGVVVDRDVAGRRLVVGLTATARLPPKRRKGGWWLDRHDRQPRIHELEAAVRTALVVSGYRE